MQGIAAQSTEQALAHVHAGGRLMIGSYTRVTIIEAKHIAQWDAVGKPLIRDDGKGFLIRRGKHADYLFPGHLRMID